MENGLVDIRKKARELSEKLGELSSYSISCFTLIAILDELEIAQRDIKTLKKELATRYGMNPDRF